MGLPWQPPPFVASLRAQIAASKAPRIRDRLRTMICHPSPLVRHAVAQTYPMVYDTIGVEAPSNDERVGASLQVLASDLKAASGVVGAPRAAEDAFVASLSPIERLTLMRVSLDALSALSSSTLVGGKAMEIVMPLLCHSDATIRHQAVDVSSRAAVQCRRVWKCRVWCATPCVQHVVSDGWASILRQPRSHLTT